MSESLKLKIISALIWSAIERVGQQAIYFFITIIIARLLSPSDYGLVGMLAIFMAISSSLVDSGFSAALIQKKNATYKDFSTIFYFNIFISIILFSVLFFSAPFIAKFYNQPRLISLTQFMALNLIINSFGLIQNTIIIKSIDFKTQTKISLVSSIASGAIGIFLAYEGFGVWSLAVQGLTSNLIRTVLLWFFNSWRPTLEFSISSLRGLFSFGSKLLASGLLDQIFDNIYKLVIGKLFSATSLGYYSQAKRIQEIPVTNLTQMVQRVTYPVYSTIQDDTQRLKRGYRNTIKAIIFINFPLMLGLAITAEPLVKVLLTEKWLPVVPYLQLLCIYGFLYPLSAVNLNILKVKGRSDIFFYLEIVKKAVIAIAILITYRWGVLALVIGQVCTGIIAFFINIYYSGKLINYSIKEQLLDIFPYFSLAALMSIFMYLVGLFFLEKSLIKTVVQIFSGAGIYLGMASALRLDANKEMISILQNNLLRQKKSVLPM
jgi:O-antigen/teichoic acid export membrane protein